MEEINKTFREAVADGRIHGAVLLAKDLTGKGNMHNPLTPLSSPPL